MNKDQKYRMSFKIPIGDKVYYIVDFKYGDVKPKRKSRKPKGVFRVYESEKVPNICGNNLGDAYMEGILSSIRDNVYEDSYKQYFLLSDWQYEDYKKYLNGDNTKTVFPLGILIVRMDKQFIHVSTVCKNDYALLDTEEQAKKRKSFVNPDRTIQNDYSREFEKRLSFLLNRFRYKKPNRDGLTFQKFINGFMNVLKENKDEIDKQKTNARKRGVVVKHMKKRAAFYAKDIFGKPHSDITKFVEYEAKMLAETILGMKGSYEYNKEKEMYQEFIKNNNIQMGGNIDYDKVEKYYGVKKDDPKREEKLKDMKRPLLSTTAHMFDFILGMSKEIGMNGVSLDSVPNMIPYDIYTNSRKFKHHRKELKPDYDYEGYEPLIPLVKHITDGSIKVEFEFNLNGARDIIENNKEGLIELGCSANNKKYTCSRIVEVEEEDIDMEEEEDIDIKGLEISTPKSLSIKTNKPKIKLDMSTPKNMSREKQRMNLSVSTPQHISKKSRPKPVLSMGTPQSISKKSGPKPVLSLSKQKDIVLPREDKRGCVGRFCDQLGDMVYGTIFPRRNKLKRRRSEDEMEMPDEKRRRLNTYNNNPAPRDIMLRAAPMSRAEFDRNRTEPMDLDKVMFGTLQNGGKRIYLMVKSKKTRRRKKKLNKGKR